ncbi:MAG: M20/M25/M40 family metallo-hydrolase [Phycisphaeraceae bacterium]|nr:M20/M25/M40 family metallo-hydrolase [Phycisphaerales bacterium]MCB9859452.1 M20/M25/M40 family metallo-hydrolase [Phycisphaeraceae bacterium]
MKITVSILVVGSALCFGGSACAQSEHATDAQHPQTDLPQYRISQQRLMDTLAALPTQRSGTGREAHWDGLKQTEQYVADELRALGLEVVTQDIPWRPPGTRKRADEPDTPQPPVFCNIIADIPGADPSLDVIVVSAHTDVVPRSKGADDDGSGVAALLEIARVLHDKPMQRTVRLAFFNLEEAGLIGSSHYVAELFDQRAADPDVPGVQWMMSLEMLGYYSDEPNSQRSPIPPIENVFEPPTVGDFLVITTVSRHQKFSQALDKAMFDAWPDAKTYLVDQFPIAPPDMLRSDHAPFLSRRIPAMMLTDTANFRNPNYHQPTDTIDTIDVERYTAVVRALAGAIHTLADPVTEETP